MASVALLSLPLEIRTMIYGYIFQSPSSHITLEQRRSTTQFCIVCDGNYPDWTLSLAPLLTCRQLYFETRHLLYTLNSIDLQLWHTREVYSNTYDPIRISQRLYLLHTHFPKADNGDVQIVDLRKTIELAIIWGQTYFDHRQGGLQPILPTGVRLVFHDLRTTPLFSPVLGKKTGKREAWRRFRWNLRECWWSIFS